MIVLILYVFIKSISSPDIHQCNWDLVLGGQQLISISLPSIPNEGLHSTRDSTLSRPLQDTYIFYCFALRSWITYESVEQSNDIVTN